MKQNKSIHADHRKRVKARFMEYGFSGFEDHEILEMLLYYALPRKDTNIIGHKLIETFGSISAVFDAPIHELSKIDGISEHTSILIKMIPQLAKVYIEDKNAEKASLSNYDEAGKFFTTKFIGLTNECFFVAFLDNGMHLIDCVLMNSGDVNSSQVSLRKIASQALEKNASFVMLAHNHPSGTVIPSGDDLSVTKACAAALDIIGVKLSEHYIVSGEKFMGILKMRASYE
jgi:DNA repair protein RadC